MVINSKFIFSGKAQVKEDIDIFPRSRKPNGDIQILDGYDTCKQTLHAADSILRVLPVLSQVNIQTTLNQHLSFISGVIILPLT